MDPQQARQRLEHLLADLARSAEVLTHTTRAAGSEPEPVDQHDADYSTTVVGNDREEASLEVVEAQRERVEEALARLDAGTYGECVDCGTKLSDERLEARPEAARCVECQQRHEEQR